MRTFILAASALASAVVAAPAFAQEEPNSDLTVSGSVGMTTDYRFRGISQSNEKFAIQGGATLTHSSGFYGTVWASSIDDYVAAGADAELDFVIGYSKEFNGITFDIGLLYYVYPSAASGVNTDFFEPYASISYAFGPVTAKGGIAYAPKNKAIAFANTKDDNLYIYGNLSGDIPNTPISLSAQLGYSKGRSLLTLGQKGYLDWNVSASYTWKNVSFGVSYVDTDIKKSSPFAAGFYDNVDPTILGSVTWSF